MVAHRHQRSQTGAQFAVRRHELRTRLITHRDEKGEQRRQRKSICRDAEQKKALIKQEAQPAERGLSLELAVTTDPRRIGEDGRADDFLRRGLRESEYQALGSLNHSRGGATVLGSGVVERHFLPYLRPEAEFKRRSHVGLPGSPPAVVSASVHTATCRIDESPIGAGSPSSLATSFCVPPCGRNSRSIFRCFNSIPIFLGRAQPIIADDRFALRGPSDPASDQLSVVGVSVHILKVVIEASVASGKVDRTGGSPLQPQIELGILGNCAK